MKYPRRLLSLSVLGTLALTLATSNATGSSRVPTYKLTDLGTAHTSFGTGYVNAINFWGQVVGVDYGIQLTYAFLSTGGQRIDISPLLPELVASSATATNIQNQVVGYFDYQVGPPVLPQSFLYRNGKLLLFKMPNSLKTMATGINAFGQIVGTYIGEDFVERPFLRQPDKRLRDLGVFGGISASASAINDRGQIAVNVVNSDQSFHALLAQPGGTAFRDIGKGTYANALNDLGQVVGSLNGHAIIYDRGKVQDVGTLPGSDSSVAYGINNLGAVVGSSRGANETAFIYIPGVGMRSLQNLTPGILTTPSGGLPLGYLLTRAVGINDRGQIAADALLFFAGDEEGHPHPVLLTPRGD